LNYFRKFFELKKLFIRREKKEGCVCVVKGGFLFLSFYLGSLGGGEVVRSVAVGDGKASGREAAYSNAAYAMLLPPRTATSASRPVSSLTTRAPGARIVLVAPPLGANQSYRWCQGYRWAASRTRPHQSSEGEQQRRVRKDWAQSS
jgi:hypothetical protein